MLKYYTLMNIMSHTNVGVRIEKQSKRVYGKSTEKIIGYSHAHSRGAMTFEI